MQTFPANPFIGNGRQIENTPNPRRRAKADVQASETALRLELAQLEHRLTRNGIGSLVVAVGIILTAMRFLGHG